MSTGKRDDVDVSVISPPSDDGVDAVVDDDKGREDVEKDAGAESDKNVEDDEKGEDMAVNTSEQEVNMADAAADDKMPEIKYEDEVEDKSVDDVVNRGCCCQILLMRLEHLLESFFYWLGDKAGSRYGIVFVIFSLLVGVAASSGIYFLKTESRAEKLWIPQDTEALNQAEFFTDNFEAAPRVSSIIMKNVKGMESSNIIRPEFLLEAMSVHEVVTQIRSTFDNQTYTELCLRFSFPPKCVQESVLKAFDFNRTILEANAASTSSLLTVINSYIRSLDDEDRIPFLQTLAGVKFDDGDNVVAATAMRMMFFLDNRAEFVNGQAVDAPAESWEENLLDAILKLRENSNFQISIQAERSLGDEFGTAIAGDGQLLSMGYLLVIVYVTLILGKLPCTSVVRSRFWLSLVLVLSIILSISSSIGLCSALQIFYGPLATLVPFLLLGLGVDDGFILSSALDNTSKYLPVRQRMAKALCHSGLSITVTSLTDVVAFLTGSITVLPALSTFCIYASVGVAFLYFFQLFLFFPVLGLDLRRFCIGFFLFFVTLFTFFFAPHLFIFYFLFRQLNDKLECCCCCHPCCERGLCKDEVAKKRSEVYLDVVLPFQEKDTAKDGAGAWEMEQEGGKGGGGQEKMNAMIKLYEDGELEDRPCFGLLQHPLSFYYSNVLLDIKVSIAVVLSAVTFVGLAIYCASHLRQEFSITLFFPDNSYLQDFLSDSNEYFAEYGEQAFIVTKRLDYFEKRESLRIFFNEMDQKPEVVEKGTLGGWWIKFEEDNNVPIATTDEYYSQLRLFLGLNPQYATAIGFRNETTRDEILFSRLRVTLKPLITSQEQVTGMDSLRTDVKTSLLSNNLSPDDVFVFSFSFVFYEQYRVIFREMLQNVLICFACCLVIVILLLPNPIISLAVFFCVFSAVAEMLGAYWLWGGNIDSVLVVITVISIGMCKKNSCSCCCCYYYYSHLIVDIDVEYSSGFFPLL